LVQNIGVEGGTEIGGKVAYISLDKLKKLSMVVRY
jgi:hypothetical protein